MRFWSAFPILDCADLAASLRFYGELLGFGATYRFPADGAAQFVALALPDGSALGLAAAGTSHAAVPAPARPRTGHAFELCLYTEDTDAAVAMLRAAGVPILVEPADQPWGERLAYVADPDGNRVHLTCRL